MLPVIDYLVNYDKISKEYCVNIERPELLCNGVCYLKEQISKTVTDEQNDDNEINTSTFTKSIEKISTFELAFETQYQLDQQLQPPI